MKKIFIPLIITIVVLVVGYIGVTAYKEPTKPTDAQHKSIVDAYMLEIDKLFHIDMSLNDGIKFIAIDTSKMTNLTKETKAQLLERLNKYNCIVLNGTMSELEKNGYISAGSFKEGILFTITDTPIVNNSFTMSAVKWRSGLGADGENGIELSYKNDKWVITKEGGGWIS